MKSQMRTSSPPYDLDTNDLAGDVKIPIPVHNVDALFAGACRFLDHENENQYAIRNGLTWKDESGWELHDRCPRLWLPNVGSGSPLLQSQGRTGIRLGPGTGVDYLVLCSHFHDRTGQLSQFTKLVFELEPANKFPNAQDTRIADAFVDVRGGPHDFFKLNDSITFNSPAVIHPFSVHFHAHSVSHTLPHSMMLDRFVIQLERKMDGQRTLLNQTVTMGQVLNFPLPQDEYHVAVGDRILFSCSYVRNKVQYPRMESIAG